MIPSSFLTCGRRDLNPHARNEHKILSLARLPVPTLPRGVISRATKIILSFKHTSVNTFENNKNIQNIQYFCPQSYIATRNSSCFCLLCKLTIANMNRPTLRLVKKLTRLFDLSERVKV